MKNSSFCLIFQVSCGQTVIGSRLSETTKGKQSAEIIPDTQIYLSISEYLSEYT